MAEKVKKTKTALKSERDALKRFERFLPTLELKKQQLRSEVSHVETQLERTNREEEKLKREVDEWVRLFGDLVSPREQVQVKEIRRGVVNIAGVNVPQFEDVQFERESYDLFATPLWLDQGVRLLERLAAIRAERQTLETARNLLNEELRITSQRVNLFEKVKIPESRENIRTIKIALGDNQTAAVVRAKISKEKLNELETETA